MNEYATDLHIHSLHSIGVSKRMTIPNIVKGSLKKGIDIIGTGDVTQPDWLKHLETSLISSDNGYTYDGAHFILTVEFEDRDAIHHVVLLPDFESVYEIRKMVSPYSPNLNHEWGGRPRVNLDAESIAAYVRDVDGLIGPAHAFTPYRSIFREGKFDSLVACYGEETQHIHFLELGLSADSAIADYIPELRSLTYICSSDAHSPSPDKIGREFVTFKMEDSSYSELEKAIKRIGGRGPILNAGLDPQLGKYYLSFCSKCRRTIIVEDGEGPPSYDDYNIYIFCSNRTERKKLLEDIHNRKVKCPVDGKNLRLGVRDRAMMLGDGTSKPPSHRPPYLHIPPLLDMIQVVSGVKSKSTKTVRTLYEKLITEFDDEVNVLTQVQVSDISKSSPKLGKIIGAYRTGDVSYRPGGGGRYGEILMEDTL